MTNIVLTTTLVFRVFEYFQDTFSGFFPVILYSKAVKDRRDGSRDQEIEDEEEVSLRYDDQVAAELRQPDDDIEFSRDQVPLLPSIP